MISFSNRLFDKLWRFEPLLFAVFLIGHTLPVLLVEYFPTVDGPSHLYNARLIAEMWSGDSVSWSSYLEYNSQFTPNWFGHSILAILLCVMPASLAEKAILLFYLIGVPVALRRLMKTAGSESQYFVYLVFPFLYSYLFHYGFFNYSIGILFFFLGLEQWIRISTRYSWQRSIVLSLIVLLIAMSHPFVFGLFVASGFTITAMEVLVKRGFAGQYQSLIAQAISLIPGLILTIVFLVGSKTLDQQVSRLPWNDLFLSLKYLMPMKGIAPDAYVIPSRVMLYSFSILLVATGTIVVYKRSMSSSSMKWASVTLITLCLLFTMPDYLGDAGFISARLMWFFFIFLLLFFSSFRFPKVVSVPLVIVSIWLGFWNVSHNYREISIASKTASELAEASEYMEEQSTVVQLNQFCGKPFTQISHYAGVERDILMLSNYEAALNYFPLVWNYNEIPPFELGDMQPSSCVHWIAGKKTGANSEQIDYLLWIREPECSFELECKPELLQNLNAFYELVFTSPSGNVSLYGKRRLKNSGDRD